MTDNKVELDLKVAETSPVVEPVNPIIGLLRSRKFLLAVAGVVNTLVAHYLDIPVPVWAAVDALIAVVIAGIAYEDGNK